MATVHKNGKIRTVKNLSWLLRHWKDVDQFAVTDTGGMVAFLRGGGTYVTTWHSLSVCRDWLDRPVFRGVPINWLGIMTTCGDITWRAPWERSSQ